MSWIGQIQAQNPQQPQATMQQSQQQAQQMLAPGMQATAAGQQGMSQLPGGGGAGGLQALLASLGAMGQGQSNPAAGLQGPMTPQAVPGAAGPPTPQMPHRLAQNTPQLTQGGPGPAQAPAAQPGQPNWAATGGGWMRAPDPSNPAYQLSFNPQTGQYDFSDPSRGIGQWAQHGGAGTLAQAEQNFQQQYGDPSGAIGQLPGAYMAAQTAQPPQPPGPQMMPRPGRALL